MTTRGSILGTEVQRLEDPRFVTGAGSYIGGLDLPGAVWVTYVRSPVAHGRITGIDTREAAAAPGVLAVFTPADLDDDRDRLAPAPPAMPFMNAAMTRPFLAVDVVRFVGEPVAAVVAETQQQGADAAELVVVDIDPRPAVVDPEDARRDEILLFPEVGTNVAVAIPAPDAEGDPFAGCEVVVEARMVNNRMAAVPLEPRACAARWDGTRLTQWSCSQGAHNAASGIAARLGLDAGQLRVITPDVGGGFGAKQGTYPEEIMVGWLARRLDRPVRWVETRSEHMLAFGHARGQVQEARLGGTRDGRLLAYELRILQDVGAYPSSYGAFMPMMTRLMASGCYALPTVHYSSAAVLTNTTPVGAFRGAGRPEAAAAIERMVDLFAREIDVDPTEVRRRNLVAPDVFPFTTPMGTTYDSGAYTQALDRALAAAGYDDLRAEQQRRRAGGNGHGARFMGIGVSSYVEVTNPFGGGEFGAVEVHADGSATVRTGSSPHGQGHHTTWAMIVSDATGIPIERIAFVYGDTDLVPRGGGTGGSRSVQAGGTAVQLATEQVVEDARRRAAEVLEANVDDVVLDPQAGGFHVVGTPTRVVSWPDVVAAAPEPLAAEIDFKPEAGTFPFGAHVAVVEVDPETGRVDLVRMIAVDDAGRVINPLLLDGQIHGGLASGIAQALYEEIRYDADGNPLTTNFADYAIVSAAELPSFELAGMETPTPLNPLGAKGIGESGSIGSTPAVQNAVVDALAHLGVRHVDLPLTPERVWRAMSGAARP
jgi:carbon-monoxide dehydrogenase large subunit